MKRFTLGFAAAALVAACSSSNSSSGPGASGSGGSKFAAGVEQIGADCSGGACGSGDNRKCALGSPKCTSNVCLVDPTQPTEHLMYCSIDCTSSPCPAGWRCEDIVSFGNRDVKRACVAEPANCGDGVVQLGEVCDGDGEQGRCVDCQKFEAVCGDGHVQEEEACDGDSPAGYCDHCKKLVPPSLTLTRVLLHATTFIDPQIRDVGLDSKANVSVGIPSPGDANGCGKLDVIEQSAELIRFKLTACDDDAKITWTIALPLADGTHVSTTDATWDAAKWQATAVLEHRASGKSSDFKGNWQTSFYQQESCYAPGTAIPGMPAAAKMGTFMVGYGSVGTGNEASISFDFSILPPIAAQ